VPELLMRTPQILRLAWGSVHDEKLVKPMRQSLAVITGPGTGVRLSRSADRWHSLRQELTLNRPGHSDGLLRLWIDGYPVLDTGPCLNLRRSQSQQILHSSLRLFPAGSTENLKHAALCRIGDLGAVRSYLPRGDGGAPCAITVPAVPLAAHEPTSLVLAVGMVRQGTHGI
jgi:hypothetical protein